MVGVKTGPTLKLLSRSKSRSKLDTGFSACGTVGALGSSAGFDFSTALGLSGVGFATVPVAFGRRSEQTIYIYIYYLFL